MGRGDELKCFDFYDRLIFDDEIHYYSMIIWNCQKVNQSNSALKPLSRLHNVPKVAFVWDILIFQAFWTFRFTGESHGAYLNLKTLVNIEGI